MREDGLLTVEGLITILGRFDPERIVIMSKDAEGNGFSPLSEITMAAYIPVSSWGGEIGLEEITELEELAGHDESSLFSSDGIPCIILEPIN